MNYTELQKANDLLGKIKEIDFTLSMIENPVRDMKIGIGDYSMYFGSEHKKKFITAINEIRVELAEELEKLGVTEDYND
jgi:hypothetical protein|nr:MAG TPA: hypothetical protein [Caudoviricetes sp.]